ncbi:hypothetical protein TL16_g13147 [Triparma laevis f. inornata]|uniref:Uncharacterized protein n=2 Tax=Triparma laevis TaxID=1534972 RepID=A0A9W7CMQ0_9STRA|nr:hypothetical protein TL16_g13147 [Triparma laevis f. inornata]GMI07469.1 hypothetical protein TrLO_g7609 [Triparma laevis f. longispina]
MTLTPHLLTVTIYDCPLLYDRIVSTAAGRFLDNVHGVCLVTFCILSLLIILYSPFATADIILTPSLKHLTNSTSDISSSLLNLPTAIASACIYMYATWCCLTIFVLGYLTTLFSPPVMHLTWLRQKLRVLSIYYTYSHDS